MADDPFDIFGADPDGGPSSKHVAVLPRASTHPHFTAAKGIWPAQQNADSQTVEQLGQAFSVEHSQRVGAALRKSRSQYGKACAKSLLAACAACAENNGAITATCREHAQQTKNLCAAAIDEANWDVTAWAEANLLALGFLLAAMLVQEDTACRDTATAEKVGAAAIALFNHAVSMACPQPAPPTWTSWVGALLGRAEAAACAAWPPYNAPTPLDSLAWAIPCHPPSHRMPRIDDTRRVVEAPTASLPCAAFFCEYLQTGKPVLIRGHLEAEQWSALTYFSDLRALHADAGDRLVPINLGSPLVGYRGVVHWPLRKLIEEHLLPSNATHGQPPAPDTAALDEESHCSVAYCSQHHLLHQHPALQELLAIPPYTVGRELSPANLWIGTRGTVTSLHSDPSDNLLCQVAGYKYFRLYALDQTHLLYATTQRGNNTNSFGTSPVRVEAPLPPEHELVREAAYVEGVLAPGDMLFIPKSVWHYVRSLTTSVSVNFWC